MKGDAYEIVVHMAGGGSVVLHVYDEGDSLLSTVQRWCLDSSAESYVPKFKFICTKKATGAERYAAEVRAFAAEVAVEFWSVKDQY